MGWQALQKQLLLLLMVDKDSYSMCGKCSKRALERLQQQPMADRVLPATVVGSYAHLQGGAGRWRSRHG